MSKIETNPDLNFAKVVEALEKKKGKPVEWIIAIFSILIFLATLLLIEEVRKTLWQLWPFIILLLALVVLTFYASKLYFNHKFETAQRENESQQKENESQFQEMQAKLKQTEDELEKYKSKPMPYFERFEKITGIRYGHIDYPPLLYHDDPEGNPQGIGIAILRKIFLKNGFVSDHLLMHWDEIEKLLYEKDSQNSDRYRIDIIATPIFETNDRSQKVGFTSPIFYTEIGLYYSKESRFLRNLKPPLDFDTAIATIRGHRGIKSCVIDGELSERMVKKYFSEHDTGVNCKHYKKGKMEIPQLLEHVYRGESDFAFVETFQADLLIKYKDKLINLLGPKELLYPVAFALRKEDYVLRRYINLKLLELDLYSPDGVLGLVKQELEKRNATFFSDLITNDRKMEKVRKYFIREYDAVEMQGANILHLGSRNINP